eukprot:Nk52_evm76s207 gene=Nk52_evmTU76s207
MGFVKDTLSGLDEDIASTASDRSAIGGYHCVDNLSVALEETHNTCHFQKQEVKSLYKVINSIVQEEEAKQSSLRDLSSVFDHLSCSIENDGQKKTCVEKCALVLKSLAELNNEIADLSANFIQNRKNHLYVPSRNFVKDSNMAEEKKLCDKGIANFNWTQGKLKKKKITEVREREELQAQLEDDKRNLQYYACKYFLKASEASSFRNITLMEHLIEDYYSQKAHFEDALESLKKRENMMQELSISLECEKKKNAEEQDEIMRLKERVSNFECVERICTPKVQHKSKPALVVEAEPIQLPYLEKAGYVNRLSWKFVKKFKRRYCVVKNGKLYLYRTKASPPVSEINLITTSLKIAPEKYENSFILVSCEKSHIIQASSSAERDGWMQVIRNSITDIFENHLPDVGKQKYSSELTRMAALSAVEVFVEEARGITANDTCAECLEKKPEWISLNMGIFLCIGCAGVHRHLGVHISKVRSTKLDSLCIADVLLLKAIGNKLSNSIYEKKMASFLKPTSKSSMEARKNFIFSKYGEKKFCATNIGLHAKTEVLSSVKNNDIYRLCSVNTQLSCLKTFAEREGIKLVILAVCSNAVDCLSFLLMNGADPNEIEYETGRSPLHFAVEKNSIECAKLLLKQGAIVDVQAENEKTPLIMASELQFSEFMELLSAVAVGDMSKCQNVYTPCTTSIDFAMSREWKRKPAGVALARRNASRDLSSKHRVGISMDNLRQESGKAKKRSSALVFGSKFQTREPVVPLKEECVAPVAEVSDDSFTSDGMEYERNDNENQKECVSEPGSPTVDGVKHSLLSTECGTPSSEARRLSIDSLLHTFLENNISTPFRDINNEKKTVCLEHTDPSNYTPLKSSPTNFGSS